MAAAMAGFTMNDAITKAVSSEMNFGEIMLVRGVVAIALIATLAWHQGALRPLRTLVMKPVALRVVGEVLGTVTFLAAIVHGDYRLDNMIFHATEPRVQAVLDWELSTTGDPMADFTYLLMQWTMPGLANADLKALNIPSMEEAAQIYCNVTGSAVPDLNWYFAYNLFRLAGITQGIAGRVRDGTAANAKAMESAKRTVPLSKASWEYAQKAGAK